MSNKNSRVKDWILSIKINIFSLGFMLGIPWIVYYFIDIFNILGDSDISYDNKMIYFATFGGACFSGIVTAGGLYLTLKQNRDHLEEQKKLDLEIREQEKKEFEESLNFEKQCNEIKIKIEKCNDELKYYREIYMCLRKMLNEVMRIEANINRKNISLEYEIELFMAEFTNLTNDFVFYSNLINEVGKEFEYISKMYKKIQNIYLKSMHNMNTFSEKLYNEAKYIDKYSEKIIKKCKEINKEKYNMK